MSYKSIFCNVAPSNALDVRVVLQRKHFSTIFVYRNFGRPLKSWPSIFAKTPPPPTAREDYYPSHRIRLPTSYSPRATYTYPAGFCSPQIFRRHYDDAFSHQSELTARRLVPLFLIDKT